MSSVVSEAAELFWLICRILNVKLQITLAVWGCCDRGYLASTICLAATGITITRRHYIISLLCRHQQTIL